MDVVRQKYEEFNIFTEFPWQEIWITNVSNVEERA